MKFSAKMRKSKSYAGFAGIKVTNSTLIYQLMRISAIVILTALITFQVLLAANVSGQDMYKDKVTIGLQNESLISGLKKIEQQTSLRFYYRKADIRALPPLNLTHGTRTVDETLTVLLRHTFFSFRQINGSILLERKEQLEYVVKGKVIGIGQRPVSSAAITVRKSASDQIIQLVTTGAEGNYSFNLAEKGSYLMSITATGMDSLSISFTLRDINVLELPDVVLGKRATTLKEVIIISKKPFIEQKIDRTVVNVGAMISNAGVNALEALEKAPGVIVDQNGSITFKGKTGVVILIDDKPTYLSGDNLANYLKSLPADQLDQIELMSNPSAKYDASGNAGLINIKTKKSKMPGFNGAVVANIGQANYLRTGESLILNYRTNKVNYFSSLGYNSTKQYNTIELQRNYFNPLGSLSSIYREVASLRPSTNSSNLRLGADVYASPKTTLGVVYSGTLSTTRRANPVSSALYNGFEELDSTIAADNYRKAKFNNHGLNFNYSHKLDSLGQAINFDLDYLNYKTEMNDSFLNNTYLPNGTLITSQVVTDRLPTTIDIYSAKTDYAILFQKKVKLETGLKTSFVNTANAANYFNVINGESLVDEHKTNQFHYQENINSAYVNLTREFKRISFQLGLRAENTNVRGHQFGSLLRPDSAFQQHYTNLFPTGYALYKLDSAGNHVINAAFGRRVDRPFYQDLNPFVTIVDKYTYFAGNPFLKPQYAYTYELSYSYKSLFSASLFLNDYKDFQTETIEQNGGVFISRTSNIGQKITKGVNASSSLHLAKWWDANLYAEVVNFIFRGQVYQSALNANSTYFYIQANNQFNFGGWSAELSGFYFTDRIVGQFNLDAKSQVNVGLQKKILNNKGSLKLTARDVFLKNISSGSITNIAGASSTYRSISDSRVVMFGFSYNFGNSNNMRKRNTGGAQGEQGRVKQ